MKFSVITIAIIGLVPLFIDFFGIYTNKYLFISAMALALLSIILTIYKQRKY